jgi:2,3-bisphosphoglycerate-dependent phosphoglycerate mutase
VIATSIDRGTELILVRHGQGHCNARGVIGGRLGCSGLTDRGLRDCALIADTLRRMADSRPFDLLLCSPRLRVLQCAQLISTRLNLPVVVMEQLRGQEFGAADGQPWVQAIQTLGAPPAEVPDRAIAAGAETWTRYARRVLAALKSVLAEQDGRRLLIVGHGKTVALAGALLSGAASPATGWQPHLIAHGTLSHWVRTGSGWTAVPT